MTAAPTPTDLWHEVLAQENRADPYPLFARLRDRPVQRLDGGEYLITGYDEIIRLLHDPRVSSRPAPAAGRSAGEGPALGAAFVMEDPPEHDRHRRQTMRHFGPPHRPDFIDSLRTSITEVADRLMDDFGDDREIDIVERFAYPLPVIMICEILGVPDEDEPLFHAWSQAIIGPPEAESADERETKEREAREATRSMGEYLGALADARRDSPREDLISGLVNDHGHDGPMSRTDMLSTTIMLLIGGHETTVNMIANGTLALLRHPDVLDRVRRDPDLMPRVFEEVLRLDPPAQVTPKYRATADIDIEGATIPAGSPIWIAWAAANRDPRRFEAPDLLDPDRVGEGHLGFGTGLHSCFGAPLARLETQIALSRLFERLENPRLIADPPYRRNALLRGPSSLLVATAGRARTVHDDHTRKDLP